MELIITVNDLIEILSEKYGKKRFMVEDVKISSINSQHNPLHFKIGPGGVLTIRAREIGG